MSSKKNKRVYVKLDKNFTPEDNCYYCKIASYKTNRPIEECALDGAILSSWSNRGLSKK